MGELARARWVQDLITIAVLPVPAGRTPAAGQAGIACIGSMSPRWVTFDPRAARP
jgi:hypothetical protein